jgi:hypothetical protein
MTSRSTALVLLGDTCTLMTEADLTAQFTEYLPLRRGRPAHPGLTGPLVAAEFACGEGVADIVQAWVAAEALARWPDVWWEALTSETAAALVSHLQHRGAGSLAALAQVRGLTLPTTRRHVSDLRRAGLLEMHDGVYRLADEARVRPGSEIWAFELKLRDWRRALYQALRYRSFAHYAVVVLPERRPSVTIDVSAFALFGIGLVVVPESGGPRFAIAPRKQRPRSRVTHMAAVAQLVARPGSAD